MGERHESFHDVNPINRRQSSLFGKFTSALDSATHFAASVNYVTNRGGTPAGDPLVPSSVSRSAPVWRVERPEGSVACYESCDSLREQASCWI